MKYLVAYDLVDSGKDYHRLIAQLNQMGARPLLATTWMLDSKLTAGQVLQQLMPYHDAQERVLITELPCCNWASYNALARIESAA